MAMSGAKMSGRGQMSEAFSTAAFLSASGGLQDAYTYIARGEVFANAQTGNIVLLSQNLFQGNWTRALRYLVPLLAFAFGVAAAEYIRHRFRDMDRIHWRQPVLLVEIVLLFLVGFLPESLHLLANAVVSFCCAMQVQRHSSTTPIIYNTRSMDYLVILQAPIPTLSYTCWISFKRNMKLS